MCFNPMVTWMTAGAGITAGMILRYKNKPINLYLPLIYFATMEALQGIMYTQLSYSSSLLVHILIYLAYIHVSFQPLAINFWLGAFIKDSQKAAYHFTLKLSFIGGLFLLSRMYLSADSPLCSSYESLCSTSPSIFMGLHHIAWGLPLKGAGWNYVNPSIALHMFLFFIPGMLLGFFRLMLLFFILGPYLSSFITSIPSEQSSIWCITGFWLLMASALSCWRKPSKFLFSQ